MSETKATYTTRRGARSKQEPRIHRQDFYYCEGRFTESPSADGVLTVGYVTTEDGLVFVTMQSGSNPFTELVYASDGWNYSTLNTRCYSQRGLLIVAARFTKECFRYSNSTVIVCGNRRHE